MTADGAPLSDIEIQEYLEFACHVAELAGKVILPYFRSGASVENKLKVGYDPVTMADREAEWLIRSEITRAYPQHSILGEEFGTSFGASALTWVIDPIDGTRGFVMGLPQWGTLLALNDGARPLLGVMHQPFIGETFMGSRHGAYLRSEERTERLKTREIAELSDASVCATHPDMFSEGEEHAAFSRIARACKQTRYGTDCYGWCLLAAGLIDLVIETQLKPYDIQAPIAIIEAAGGIVTDWAGQPAYNGGRVLGAANSRLHQIALEILISSTTQKSTE
ncbi:MAG TPA: histidinol-phosphatase [Candidatus Binataceae bacterium]|nr:histidinol-phosphatase [Candidatus Binataceae bacterium]